MGDRRRSRCVVCGRHRDEVGELSWTGLCPDHSVILMIENNEQIRHKTGPAHRRRLRGYAKWLEREASAVLESEQ